MPSAPRVKTCGIYLPPITTSTAVSIDGSVVYVGYGAPVNALKAFNAQSGSEIWRFSRNLANGASPVVGQDSTVYIVTDEGWLFAVTPRATSGSEKWAFRSHTSNSSPGTPALSPGGDMVYVINPVAMKFYALSTANGALLWSYPTPTAARATPVLDSAGNIYFGNEAGVVTCLDGLTGMLKWTFKTAAGVPIRSATVPYVDGTLLFSDINLNLYSIGTAVPQCTGSAGGISPTFSSAASCACVKSCTSPPPTASPTSPPTTSPSSPPLLHLPPPRHHSQEYL